MDVYKIGEIPKSAYKLIGPKARGLNEIKKIGIKTPLGVVITNIDYEKNGDGMFHDLYLKNNFKQITLRTESNNPDVDQIYNNKQFVKIFNIEGPEMFIKAVNTAIAAYFDNMQKTFSDFFPHQQEDCLVIIVQEMIVCTKAGFCMSRNPTTGANEFYIRGIKGIGEKVLLNSSIANVYHIPYTIKNNEIVKYNKPVGDGLLSEKQLAELIIDACNIKKIINDNVDLN
jgi:phosphoenolpyruvate synthase/pyruvate phosphate dikinase